MTLNLKFKYEPNVNELSAPKAILFDWDDTIIETWPHLYDIYKVIYDKYDTPIPSSDEMHEIAVRHGRQYTIDQIGKQALDDLIELYDQTFHERMALLPEVKDALDMLKSFNIPMGIVSNKEHETLVLEVNKLQLDQYFNPSVGRCIKGAKPSPDGALHALENMGIEPSKDVWFIGDSIVDHETARNGGFFSVVFGHGSHEGDLGVANWNQFTRILETIFAKIC